MSRKNINLTDPVEERAQAIIERRGFNGLSDMIATLVREEFERRGLTSAATTMRDASSEKGEALAKEIASGALAAAAATPPNATVSYKSKRQAQRHSIAPPAGEAPSKKH